MKRQILIDVLLSNNMVFWFVAYNNTDWFMRANVIRYGPYV
jgi:hypothetical protein